MTITRTDVADLRPGDVVQVTEDCDGDDVTTRGPVRADGNVLTLGGYTLRRSDGEPAPWYHSLTVVSRAPRPLYVNHPRTEPVAGDVVRVEFGTDYEDDWCMNAYAPVDDDSGLPPWLSIAREDSGCRYTADMVIPTPGSKGRMRLLVDGETGQVVP